MIASGSLPTGYVDCTSSLEGKSDLDKDLKESPASKSVHRQRAERDVPDSNNVTFTMLISVNTLASQQTVLIEDALRFFKRTLIENKW